MIAEEQWLSTLRPSRVRMVQAGAPAWAEAELIDVESGQAALGPALEAFGLRVRRTAVGQARHLVAALSEPPAADFVVLQCHGDEGAIVLPGLAEEVERYQPFHGRISPADLRAFARFDGTVVVATGCDTGHPGLAGAVLDCGATAYIAPDGAPFAYASFVAPLLLFYELTKLRDLGEAVRHLRAHDDELAMWRLYR